MYFYRLSLQFVIMSEEDLTKLLVRVDVPDIKTQVIIVHSAKSSSYCVLELCSSIDTIPRKMYSIYGSAVCLIHAHFKSNGTLDVSFKNSLNLKGAARRSV